MSERERDIVNKAAPYEPPPDPTERYRKHESYPLAWADWPEDRSSYVSEKGNPTVKWRGISINRLRDRANEFHTAAIAARFAERVARRAREEYEQEVLSLLGIKADIGRATCEESPAGTCIYPVYGERNADPWCLFCAKPEYEKLKEEAERLDG